MSKQSGMVRVEHLDGLRGLAALLVVVTHYVQTFVPGVFNPEPTIQHGYEVLFATTPLNIILNGHFWVAVFFVLSGYVLSLPGQTNPSTRWAVSAAAKRFPRLMLPAFASAVFAWVVGALTQGKYLAVVYPTTLSLMTNQYADVGSFWSTVLRDGIGFFYIGYSPINPVLWTLSIELIGSLFVIAIVWLIPEFKRRCLACLVVVVLVAGHYWFPAFALGIIAGEIMARFTFFGPLKALAILVSVVLALWMGSYPYYGIMDGVWGYLPVVPGNNFDFYSSMGAFFAVMAVSISLTAKSVLSSRVFRYLGDISFAVYLIHFPLLTCIATYFVHVALQYFSYWNALMVALVPSMAIVWLSAEVFRKAVDLPSIRMSRWVGKKVSNAYLMINQKAPDALGRPLDS
ncbi:acyltransferase family protein [Pseudomonas sp.]|uniref:acyltransferase family protein n=1 Tax=Pseudomonas sp. TaxID=306 RepID=UPI003F33EAC5